MANMDAYKGRKAPNVSNYLANLNAIPSTRDVANQHQQEDFNFDDELAQFTNAEFLDQDVGDFLEQQPMSEYGSALEEKARMENATANNEIAGTGMDFMTGMLHVALDTVVASSIMHHLDQSAVPRPKRTHPKSSYAMHDSSLTQLHQATSHSPA